MFLNLILFFNIFILINGNKQFHFGIINHHTQWYFHCPQNNTKILEPPLNDQPLISYECQNLSSIIEILPIEIDFTFLCRLQSRLIWIIIDLYQYNTYLWLINKNDIEINIELNNKIQINNSKNEINNYINHIIITNAFYIPFESIDLLLNKQIEINIKIKNLNQLNQCQFYIKDNYLWKIFINNYCHLSQSKKLFIQYAKCDFYTNHRIRDNVIISTTNHSINKDESSSDNYEEYYRQILLSLSRTTLNTTLLMLTFLFLLITLIILIIFFLYMLCYHYHIRLRSSSIIRNSSVSI